MSKPCKCKYCANAVTSKDWAEASIYHANKALKYSATGVVIAIISIILGIISVLYKIFIA